MGEDAVDVRPVFVGNFEYSTVARDVEKLFERYGRVKKMDMKQGEVRKREKERRESMKSNPSNTLFVVNFDPSNTRVRELEKVFSPYGNVVRYDMQRNFAFVQYDTIEEATKALEGTNGSFIGENQVTVEYTYRQRSITDRENRSRKRDSSPFDRREPRDRFDDGYRRRRRDDRNESYGHRRSSPDRERDRDGGDRDRDPPRNRRRSPEYRDRDRSSPRERNRDRSRDRTDRKRDYVDRSRY